MIRYQKLSGVRLGGAVDLPRIVETPEGRAMGGIPGWGLLLDPSYVDEGDGWALNRARAESYAQSSNPPIGIRDLPNGQPVFFREDGIHDTNPNFTVPVKMNPTEWSFFSVMRQLSGGQGAILLRNAAEADGEIAPYISTSANGLHLTVWEAAQSTASPERLRVTGVLTMGVIHLVMATFSVSRGLELFVNGVSVGSAPEDTRALTAGYGAGEYQALWSARGDYGMLGLLSIDLGKPEHAGYRRSIERFLMDKYGITA